MKNIFKNKVVTIVVLLATLVLAGIAVFTAIRLYQLRQESVAPNAPSSEPQAIGFNTPDPTATPGSCSQLSFTLTTPPPGTCAYIVTPSTLSMRPGETRPINIRISGDPGTANGHRVVVTSRNTTIATVAPGTCSGFGPCSDEVYNVTARAVGTTIIDIKSPNNRTGTTTPLCTATVTITASTTATTPPGTTPPGTTPPGTTPPGTTPPGTTPPGTTPPATPTATPISCNNSCTVDEECQSDLVCSAGKCRHPNCTGETDCNCDVAQGSPTTPPAGGTTSPTLPETGFSLPTIIGGGLGILVILGAILLLI